MPQLTLVWDIAILLVTAFFGALVARKLRQPLILGYLVAGLTVGSLAIQAVRGGEVLLALAEIGVAFLMFSLGVEFSLARLSRVRTVAVWGGVVQILLTILLGALLFPRFGFDFYSSLFLAAAFSLSSTAVVVKILTERAEIDSLPGEIMLGWLVIQDLAVLPMLLLLPALAEVDFSGFLPVLLALAKSGIILVAVFWLAAKAVPAALDWIVGLNSRELLVLAVVSFVLFSAIAASLIGLSPALGAFLAGLIVAETSQNHAIFAEIRPLRDVFSILFFVSLGMLVQPAFLVAHLTQIVALAAIVIIIKLILVTALVLYLGYHAKTAVIVGMGLVQVGEFAFVLVRVGLTQGLVDELVYSTVLAVAILTILVTPSFVSLAPKAYIFLRHFSSRRLPRLYGYLFAKYDARPRLDELELEGHVVVCGYGRVGRWLGRALQLTQVPYVVIDYNWQVVSQLQEEGVKVIYGDPTERDVLDAAQTEKARAIVIAIPDRRTQELVISHAQTLNKKILIVSRAHHHDEQIRLKDLGAAEVVEPEFEAGLSMIHRLLQHFGVPREEVAGKIKRIKIEHGMMK